MKQVMVCVCAPTSRWSVEEEIKPESLRPADASPPSSKVALTPEKGSSGGGEACGGVVGGG